MSEGGSARDTAGSGLDGAGSEQLQQYAELVDSFKNNDYLMDLLMGATTSSSVNTNSGYSNVGGAQRFGRSSRSNEGMCDPLPGSISLDSILRNMSRRERRALRARIAELDIIEDNNRRYRDRNGLLDDGIWSGRHSRGRRNVNQYNSDAYYDGGRHHGGASASSRRASDDAYVARGGRGVHRVDRVAVIRRNNRFSMSSKRVLTRLELASRGRYACSAGRVRRNNRCSRVRSPLHQCGRRVEINPSCTPDAAADLICPEGFSLEGDTCALVFPTISDCPSGTSLFGGACVPSSMVNTTGQSYSSSHRKLSDTSGGDVNVECPLNSVAYHNQCLPLIKSTVVLSTPNSSDSSGRRLLATAKGNVIATCPSGYVAVDSDSMSSVLHEQQQLHSRNGNKKKNDPSYNNTTAAARSTAASSSTVNKPSAPVVATAAAVGGKVCARIVEAAAHCPEGYSLQLNTSTGEEYCGRQFRNRVTAVDCGHGMTLSDDGMACTGKRRSPPALLCERGRFDGKRCVGYTLEEPALLCPHGYSTQNTAEGYICNNVKRQLLPHLSEDKVASQFVLPHKRCEDITGEDGRCYRRQPTESRLIQQCPRGTVPEEVGGQAGGGQVECVEIVRKRPHVLCRDPATAEESEEACVKKSVVTAKRSCPANTSPLCLNKKQRGSNATAADGDNSAGQEEVDGCSSNDNLCLHQVRPQLSGRKLSVDTSGTNTTGTN
eukprot:Lankesteria_metandrocarpae@DN2441_c0_g1_i1.p1